jgi:membrane dipeptidase
MMIDISHVSDKTFYDAVAVSKAPVIASHSSSRALANVPRNMTDDMLRALAKNGGVAQVNFYPVFLSDDVAKANKERNEKLKPAIAELKAKDPSEGPAYEAGVKALMEANPLPKVSYTAIVDHIDHMVKVAGIDHVGIGSDFDGIGNTPEGMEDVSHLPAIREEMKRRGYSESDIRKVMGDNFMRVFAEVERVARTLQSTPAGNAAP